MEQLASEPSGIANPSIASRSNASLPGTSSLVSCSTSLTFSSGNAVPPAGAADHDDNPFADPPDGTVLTTTPAGAPVATTAVEPPTGQEQPPTAPPKPPLYKRRWFIITNIVGACIGIALLFIVLFPVVKAIIQDVVNKTTLDITSAAIINPTNTS